MSDEIEPLNDRDIETLRQLLEKCGSENVLIEIQNILLEKNGDEGK